MNTTHSFVLQLILVVVVIAVLFSGCGPPTEAEKKNYEKNIKEIGNHRNLMPLSIIFTMIAVVTGAAVFWHKPRKIASVLYRWLTDSRIAKMKMNIANFACAAICICVATLFLCAMDMEGCNTTDDSVLDEDPATFLQAMPPSGSEIEPTQNIVANFDAPPTGLTATSSGAFSIAVLGAEATITGPFTPGPLNLVLTWENREITLSYTVKLPAIGEEVIFASNEGDGRTMVFIPAGEFTMGSDDADPDVWIYAGPAHKVYVDAFYMDTHEVTNADYKKFVDANPEWQKDNLPEILFYLENWKGNTYPLWKGDHPVTNVTWHAAMAYAEWAGKRLPTEAEWEKAARGGLIDKKYPWGNEITEHDANHNYRIGDTREVGKYRPNDYGLHDMAGNVWELCLDHADTDFYKQSPNKNPLAGVTGNTLANLHEITTDFKAVETLRIIRGGSCFSRIEDVQVTIRAPENPNRALGSVGFRCVRSP